MARASRTVIIKSIKLPREVFRVFVELGYVPQHGRATSDARC